CRRWPGWRRPGQRSAGGPAPGSRRRAIRTGPSPALSPVPFRGSRASPASPWGFAVRRCSLPGGLRRQEPGNETADWDYYSSLTDNSPRPRPGPPRPRTAVANLLLRLPADPRRADPSGAGSSQLLVKRLIAADHLLEAEAVDHLLPAGVRQPLPQPRLLQQA